MANSKYSFTLNSDLYIKDPTSSETGRKVIASGAKLILATGLEAYTAKKLATEAGITEATVYKYFANKQRLLQYYFQLYWTWLEQQVKVFTAIETDPEQRLIKAVRVISNIPSVAADPGVISKEDLRELVINEGSKAYYHVMVDEDNAKRIFAPYKSITALLAEMIKAVQPEEKYPLALATTIIEMSHSLKYFAKHLPALTDFPRETDQAKLDDFLIQLLFNSPKIKP
jgi:AcrR family transcriptional regulator